MSNSSKKEYSAPQLTCFGGIRELTLNNPNGSPENDHPSKPGTCVAAAPSFEKRPCPGASERELKENISLLGMHPFIDIGLYLFDYKNDYKSEWGQGRQFGVMADEVDAVMPAAISRHPDGYRLVNYNMLGFYQRNH